MVERVKGWLAEGREVRIFTARVYCPPPGEDGFLERRSEVFRGISLITAWCMEHVGQALVVTCTKDYGMIELWDDRAIRVVANTGNPCCK
ncbi:MAG TPA: hypothetical protein VGP89_17920 [Candidatus Angelobacter sp.]|jgi:hypothetical protein|nr:hypothetical protein [Candidatus Angelobacter sp.]